MGKLEPSEGGNYVVKVVLTGEVLKKRLKDPRPGRLENGFLHLGEAELNGLQDP